MNQILSGKVVLVTGASQGLGRRIVDVFRQQGAVGIGFDQFWEDEPNMGEGWIAYKGDVTEEESLVAAVEAIGNIHGRLDVVVANAGIVPPWSKVEELDMSQWDRAFAVNVRGVAITMKHCVPLMKDNGGSFILMGSLNSRRGAVGQTLYTATKHAVLGIVRSSALDLGTHDIRVNAIGPGPIATDALVSRIATRHEQGDLPVAEVLEKFKSGTALNRIATDKEVANTGLFLASDFSSGITGQIFPVDGGLP